MNFLQEDFGEGNNAHFLHHEETTKSGEKSMEVGTPLPAIFCPSQEYLYQGRLDWKNEKRRVKAAEQRAKRQEEKEERRREQEEEKEEAREQKKQKQK